MTDEDYAGLEELDELANITDTKELDCLFNFLRTPYAPSSSAEEAAGLLVCNSTWDGLLCWPNTLAGSTSVLPCFEKLNGINYDTSRRCT